MRGIRIWLVCLRFALRDVDCQPGNSGPTPAGVEGDENGLAQPDFAAGQQNHPVVRCVLASRAESIAPERSDSVRVGRMHDARSEIGLAAPAYGKAEEQLRAPADESELHRSRFISHTMPVEALERG